jgi:3-isopropylmalate/(R)-2-methylmalate dehydratase large subunit
VKKPKEMKIVLEGKFSEGVSAKDAVMWIIRSIGTGGAIGYVVEFGGSTISAMTLEERMTIANMIIEGGARTAIIEPDEKVFDYIRGRAYSPRGRQWDEGLEYWKTLRSDENATRDSSHLFAVGSLEPQVSWGTNPAMTVGVSESVPIPTDFSEAGERAAAARALKYMGLAGGERITDIPIERVFVGSCTNARVSDLLDAARVIGDKRVARGVRAMVVPGSQQVKREAEKIGLDRIFIRAGFEWRNSGCSLCIGMNDDRLSQGERCAATSNRNFENRMGPGGRTHLMSPMTATASALAGKLADPRKVGILPTIELGLIGSHA